MRTRQKSLMRTCARGCPRPTALCFFPNRCPLANTLQTVKCLRSRHANGYLDPILRRGRVYPVLTAEVLTEASQTPTLRFR